MQTGFSPRVDAALILAARAHRTQVRKGTDIPYIVHPVQVALILLRHGFDEDLVVAGVLHDTVEDTDVEAEDIRSRFGAEVAALVAAVSEAKVDGDGARRPWRTRKAEQVAHLERADARVAALKAADALHNLQSTLADLKTVGAAVFQRFNAPPEDWLWYYGTVARLVGERLGDHALARELEAVMAEIAALVPVSS
jgi:(p)ppGpp synthase/HD superfamily hydrolase